MKQGLFTGVVVDNQDPDRIGRVKVQIPGTDEETWARIATLMAGSDRGTVARAVLTADRGSLRPPNRP